MARQVLPVIGAVIGGYVGGPQGAQIGWAIGSTVGNVVDPQIIRGPSIGDLGQQTSQEGVPRPIVYGISPPIAGNIIVSGEPRIVRTRQSQGKGGPKTETESVYRTYAIRICEGPAPSLIRAWRNNVLVYDRSADNADNTKFILNYRYYQGTFDQEPDPDLEAILGVGTTPAHRGTAYLVAPDEDLTDLRGAIPQWVFQVGSVDAVDEIVYLESDTWVHPPGLKEIAVHVRAGGGGGGAGAAGSGGETRQGGAAGGGGGFSFATIPASSLGPTEAVTVGQGGAGGAGRDTNGVGENGQNGGNSSFGSHVVAEGGFGGTGGNRAGIVNGSKGGDGTTSDGGDGGQAAATAGNGKSSNGAGGGGGSGGSRFASGPVAAGNGGIGGSFSSSPALGGSGGAGSAGADGEQGNESLEDYGPGGGGGGGATGQPSGTGDRPGGDGGAGGRYGGGGGGGGSRTSFGFSGDGGNGANGVVRVQQVFEETSTDLDDVVTDLCLRAGIPAELIDVSDLEGIPISGFAVINTYPCYAALRSLSEIFFFDPANYDGQIHFVRRGGNSVVTITEDDLIDDEEEGWDQDQRADAIQIPRVLHLNYYDVDGGLATDKQSSERAGDRRSVGEISLQSAVVMTADEAARAVTVNHKVLIEDQKGESKFSLPDSFIRLVPTNPIIMQVGGRSERFRLTAARINDGFQQYTALRDRQSSYTSNVEGIPAAPQTPPPSSIVGPTLLRPLDIHILRDADDQLCYYVAVSGVLEAWQGATVELSLDGGENYIDSQTTRSAAIMGETITDLPDHPQAYPDQVHTVRVRIDTPYAELESTDLAGLLNRQNLAIIDNELVQFAAADEVSEGVWDLSYLLRGRKGTQTTEHASGARFVLLDRGVLGFVPANLTDLNRTLTFRATSFGTTVDQGTVRTMLFTGASQTERQPAYLQVSPISDSSGERLITWQGVGRLGAGATVAHGGYFIGYRVTITDGVLTEVEDTLDQELSVDLSGFSTPITIQVQQRNQLTGLGPAAEVIIS